MKAKATELTSKARRQTFDGPASYTTRTTALRKSDMLSVARALEILPPTHTAHDEAVEWVGIDPYVGGKHDLAEVVEIGFADGRVFRRVYIDSAPETEAWGFDGYLLVYTR